MRKLLTILAFSAIAIAAYAIPAKRTVTTVRQSDGTELQIMLRGDETFHFYTTLDGTPVRQNAQGDWVADTRDIAGIWTARSEARNKQRIARAEKTRRMMRSRRAGSAEPATKKGLLILVNFKDKKMQSGSTQAVFNQMMNGIDNPYGQNPGSVREYFRSQSYGQFDIEFDVVGPVTLSQNMSYYGKDEGGQGNDAHAGQMVADACKLVNSQVNFADYDWDGDGEVENIYVTYAGYGQASGAPSSTIWPHQWVLSESYGQSLTLDGVTIETYACGSELAGSSGTKIDGIGTMCHEYSHCLGLPDFYDTRNVDNRNFGMSVWSVMDYGCYNGDGYCPCGYTAYERWVSGWLEPVEINSKTSVKDMKPIETDPEAYVIYNDANHNEYYLLANHQKKDWDKKQYGHGLMVLHVDYDKDAWINNTVNNTSSRQRMTIIPADNNLDDGSSSSLAGDLWPGTSKKTELTDDSSPAAKLYRANTDGKKFMHKPITGITEASGLISFDVLKNAVSIEAPVIDESKCSVTVNSLTAVWGAVEGAASYNLSLTERTSSGDNPSGDLVEALLLYEDFEKFVKDESDGTADISSKLDDYTYVSGWTGEKVYQGIDGAKLGTSNSKGYLTTPPIACRTGNLTLWIACYDWINSTGKADGSTLDVIIVGLDGEELKKINITPNDNEASFVVFNNVPLVSHIKFSTTGGKKRVYLGGIVCFDGEYSQDEVEALIYSNSEEADNANRRHIIRRASQSSDVTNVQGTTYAFTDLTPGSKCTFMVQAVDADGNLSAWSSPVTLTLPDDPNAIQQLEDTSSNMRKTSSIAYDLQGRQMANGKQRKGLYIRDGRKFIVK